jgi:hypothetical protein
MSAGRPNLGSSYAVQGTAAHEVAATCLREKWQAIELLDRTIEVTAGYQVAGEPHVEKILCDEEMVAGVQMYLDLCAEEAAGDSLTFIEHRVDLRQFDPEFGEPMFGTCDFGAYRRHDRTLVVIDLKYGQGVVVEVEGKPQTRYYALGLLLDPALADAPIERVEVVICQPRAWHPDGPIRRECLSADELIAWADTVLLPAARRTLDPEAPLVAGEHCMFCPAASDCEERRRVELSNAMVAFDDLDAVPARDAAPPPIDSLTPEQRARLLEVSDRIMAWLKDFREDCFRRLNEEPGSIPGWKIVGRKGHRRWTGETPEETAARLAFEFGVPPAECWGKPRLKSPAQIETTIRKLNPHRSHEVRVLKQQLCGLYETPVTGTTLARAGDPRPALIGTDIAQFDVIAGDGV